MPRSRRSFVSPPPVVAPAAPADRDRILATARTHFFTYGYSALNMDELARELGMSKKTLYVHVRSKDALVEDLLNNFGAGVSSAAEQLFGDSSLTFPVRVFRFGEEMTRRLAELKPHTLRDLQRFAPHLYRKLEELRSRNIPLIFGRILRDGQAAGMVRQDVDVTFAVLFWRAAIQSLMHPDALEQLGLAPHEVMRRAVDLFFGGLLTPAGHQDYEKHLGF